MAKLVLSARLKDPLELGFTQFIWGLVKAARPRQWIKNFALFAGLIFSGQLDQPQSLLVISQAFIIFCGLSSATYFVNDVFDIERDKQHPFKNRRPIASGIIPAPLAVILALFAIAVLLPLSYQIAPPLFYAATAYLILQVFYSAYLKSVILLDVIMIATGFVLRVYAGIWAIDAHLNVWFLLSITSLALFLAIGKRRSERTLMLSADAAGKHRETLLHYPESLLDSLTTMFANSTWLTYALFAFQQPPIMVKSPIMGFGDLITIPLAEAKFLMVTVPIVIYAVMRYLYIIYEKKEGETPERVLLTDTPLLSTVIIWLIVVIFIIYYLGG